jgi:hypothetical protein
MAELNIDFIDKLKNYMFTNAVIKVVTSEQPITEREWKEFGFSLKVEPDFDINDSVKMCEYIIKMEHNPLKYISWPALELVINQTLDIIKLDNSLTLEQASEKYKTMVTEKIIGQLALKESNEQNKIIDELASHFLYKYGDSIDETIEYVNKLLNARVQKKCA